MTILIERVYYTYEKDEKARSVSSALFDDKGRQDIIYRLRYFKTFGFSSVGQMCVQRPMGVGICLCFDTFAVSSASFCGKDIQYTTTHNS